MSPKKWLILSVILNIVFCIVSIFFVIMFHDRITKKMTADKTVDIVMFGDSITEGGDWASLFTDKKIYNSGTMGATTSRYVWTLKKDVLQHHPKICFILGGTNDIFQGIPASRTLDNMNKIISSLQANNIIPVLQSVPYSAKIKEHNNLVDSINIKLKQLAGEKHMDYIDLNETLSENGFLKKEYTYDGIHFSENAYPVWAEKVKEVLSKHNL
ncbi:GDSL-type esterase/lipase family protein [Ferruginibacter albus]|uniref:GDSL-type esterase/lipase family protein n=1 Tax=Ferruginibacter albus TaxID=2875540 RepID=UPI001CC80ACD|nr:GDSL-type esterase/lipase family protein [Ferruginibacter albus]UAY53017.1 hypothetical protein K9M53_04890 [Ferruginibacter albus]